MRVTCVLHKQRARNLFNFKWMIQARKRIHEDGTKEALLTRGIQVFHPEDILTPPIPRKEEQPRPTLEESFMPPPPVKHKTPCYVLTPYFSPVMGLPQAQLITNTLARLSLPTPITDYAAAVSANSSPEVDERVKEAILHAHLLDTYQARLPRIHDVINNPGWIFEREYGIPLPRRHKTLTYELLLLLDQVEACGLERQVVENGTTVVMLPHGNRLMQMKHKAAFLVSSPNPLAPPATQEDLQTAASSEEMPDIYPLSPFNNCWPRNTYTLDECYAVDSPHLHPHTIFIHHNQPRMPHTEDTFMGMTLLYAFSHAAAYAKLVQKNPVGDLAKPITVQIVHMNRQHYHFGVFQLNTLNLAPDTSKTPVRNLFWTQPWDSLFDSCSFKAGRPVLERYNPKVFSLLRALHAQG